MSLPKRPLVATCLAFTALLAGQAQAACHAAIQLTRPDSLYSDNFDGTVTDTDTGLVWAKCSLGQSWVDNTPNDGSDDQCSGTATTYTWKAALEAVQSANSSSYLGQGDWRLPNKNELASLVESACVSPAINSNRFPATPSSVYWTSSLYAGYSNGAWIVYFLNGHVGGNNKSISGAVRVVRGGQ